MMSKAFWIAESYQTKQIELLPEKKGKVCHPIQQNDGFKYLISPLNDRHYLTSMHVPSGIGGGVGKWSPCGWKPFSSAM